MAKLLKIITVPDYEGIGEQQITDQEQYNLDYGLWESFDLDPTKPYTEYNQVIELTEIAYLNGVMPLDDKDLTDWFYSYPYQDPYNGLEETYSLHPSCIEEKALIQKTLKAMVEQTWGKE